MNERCSNEIGIPARHGNAGRMKELGSIITKARTTVGRRYASFGDQRHSILPPGVTIAVS